MPEIMRSSFWDAIWNKLYKRIPNCGRSWGFLVRYKGLPEGHSTYALCGCCSSCTNTLLHLRLSQGMSQTAGNQCTRTMAFSPLQYKLCHSPIGMSSKIFQVCFYTTVHSAILGVARRFWRSARRHLLMFAMTLVWLKVRNTGNYSGKHLLMYVQTYV